MSDLRWMVSRVASALALLSETTHLIITRDGSEGYVDESGSNRFVQFARFGTSMRAESVGDRYLAEADRLSDDQQAALERLGWQAPDEGGNYWRHWTAPLPLNEIATVALHTLEQVHGAASSEQLRFDATPEILGALSTAEPSRNGATPAVADAGNRRSSPRKTVMRYFAVLNGADIIGLVRFDRHMVMTWRFDWRAQEWVPDQSGMDIVTGRDFDAREVDAAEAERIRTEILKPAPLE